MPDGFAVLIGKDRSGDGNCYFARPSFFSCVHARMTCTLVTRLYGVKTPSPLPACNVLCLYPVYHVLPALDDFGHESPRKCAETPRAPAKNRKPSGLRLPDGFLLYGKIWKWRIFRVCLCLCIIPLTAAKVELFCVNNYKNISNRVQKAQKALAAGLYGRKKGTAAQCCTAAPV